MEKPLPSRPDQSREAEDTRRPSDIENRNMSRVYLFETKVHLAAFERELMVAFDDWRILTDSSSN